METLIFIFLSVFTILFLIPEVKAPVNNETLIVNNTVDVETIVTTYKEPIDLWQNVPKESLPNPLLEQKGDLRNAGGYIEGECELAAKTWQKEYGGELVFIVPYDTTNNRWITGQYVGAWINKKGNLYVDYFNQKTYESKDDVIFFYKPLIQIKNNNYNIDLKVFIIGIDTVPFNIRYNY